MGRLQSGDNFDARRPGKRVERATGSDATARASLGLVDVHAPQAGDPARQLRMVGNEGEDHGWWCAQLADCIELHWWHLWEFDGNVWMQRRVSTMPSARYGFAMATRNELDIRPTQVPCGSMRVRGARPLAGPNDSCDDIGRAEALDRLPVPCNYRPRIRGGVRIEQIVGGGRRRQWRAR
jgi:hypothetical protein